MQLDDGYEIIETDFYKRKLKFLCESAAVSVELVRDVLGGVLWSVKTGARQATAVPGEENTFTIKTYRINRQNQSIPSCILVFKVVNAKRVELMSIQSIDLFL